jgi:hypothetical protein
VENRRRSGEADEVGLDRPIHASCHLGPAFAGKSLVFSRIFLTQFRHVIPCISPTCGSPLVLFLFSPYKILIHQNLWNSVSSNPILWWCLHLYPFSCLVDGWNHIIITVNTRHRPCACQLMWQPREVCNLVLKLRNHPLTQELALFIWEWGSGKPWWRARAFCGKPQQRGVGKPWWRAKPRDKSLCHRVLVKFLSFFISYCEHVRVWGRSIYLHLFCRF